jgi:tetratricopeptide (TPR) repeat protein
LVERWIRLSLEWLESHRTHWPQPFRRLNGRGYLMLGGLLGLSLLAGVVWLLRPKSLPHAAVVMANASGSAGIRAASASAVSALADGLAQAKGGGSAALVALAAKYPNSAELWLELAKTYLVEKKPVEAVTATQRALRTDPRLNQNSEVMRALWQTSQLPESMEPTFTLLEGPMGSKGADVVYDLITTPAVRKEVKKRGEDFLKSDRFAEQASAGLKVAVALRAAPYCEKAYQLLPEAKESGDERALKQLRRYASTVGCGRRSKRDCFPCMHRDGRLKEAMQAIEQRTKPAVAKPAAAK